MWLFLPVIILLIRFYWWSPEFINRVQFSFWLEHFPNGPKCLAALLYLCPPGGLLSLCCLVSVTRLLSCSHGEIQLRGLMAASISDSLIWFASSPCLASWILVSVSGSGVSLSLNRSLVLHLACRMHHHKVFLNWWLTPRTDGTESDWILSSIVSWLTGCLAGGWTVRLTCVSFSRSPDDAVMLSRLMIHVLTQAGSLH